MSNKDGLGFKESAVLIVGAVFCVTVLFYVGRFLWSLV